MTGAVDITVAGSVNLDITAYAPVLPAPGQTVGGARIARFPGGKGANQALAAQRLGGNVALIAATGADEMADEALSLLRSGGVNLSGVAAINGETTGVALIAVDQKGENQIIVAPGANACLRPEDVTAQPISNLISVLEIPVGTVLAAAQHASGFVSINLAPALPVPADLMDRADLIVVNETEAAFYGEALHRRAGLTAISLGAEGAALFREGCEIARSRPPRVDVIDTVGAGDTFTAALSLALIEGQAHHAALRFAVAASALAVTRKGAQPSLPHRSEVAEMLARNSQS